MNLRHVWLVFCRELRDQFRDRRTLFMIVVLPLVLYPLLGMSLFQIRQFMQEKAIRVLVLGLEYLDGVEPPLVEGGQFAGGLFDDPAEARLVELIDARQVPGFGPSLSWLQKQEQTKLAVQAGLYEAALTIPPDFARQLTRLREAMKTQVDQTRWPDSWPPKGNPPERILETTNTERSEANSQSYAPSGRKSTEEVIPATMRVPSPEIFYSTATERSQLAFGRVSEIVARWREVIAAGNLEASGVPIQAVRPFEFRKADVAEQTAFRGAAVWAKILPVMLVLWALTGAFYPAIDLCAGEKERGTLETLLSSPVEREDIVVGKLMTVMLFSMLTAVLNVGAIGLTGWLLLAQLPGIGVPSMWSVLWLLLALVPMSALFGALCLALAAMARSTKEGQYYLMPLLLISMPLAIWPMAPGVELTLGSSLIPVSGVVLVLKAAIEGNGWKAMEFLPPVVAVTLGCAAVAVRWAVEQFNSEKVLFRSGERWELRVWLRQLVRNRQARPTAAAALACGLSILMLKFFMTVSLVQVNNFMLNVFVSQLVVVLAPAVLFGWLLARSPKETFLLRWPGQAWGGLLPIAGAGLLAAAIHPTAMLFQAAIMHLYPIDPTILQAFDQAVRSLPSFWHLLLLAALLPAVCEELTFRGFVLSGFCGAGRPLRAAFYTALFFGLTHPILQQAIGAWAVGMVLGLLAIWTRSILPPIAFHLVYNSISLSWAFLGEPKACPADLIYPWPVVLGSMLSSSLLMGWFWKRANAMSISDSSCLEMQSSDAREGSALFGVSAQLDAEAPQVCPPADPCTPCKT